MNSQLENKRLRWTSLFCLLAGGFVTTLFLATVPCGAATVVLPWQEIGIDREVVAKSRTTLNQAQTNIANALVSTNWRSLADLRPDAPLTWKVLTSGVLIDMAPSSSNSGQNNADQSTTAYVPVWCSLGDSYVFGLSAVDLQQDTLIGAKFWRQNRQEWQANPKFAVSALNELVASVKAQAARPATDNSALRVGMSLRQETTRLDQGSSICLNLLAASRLAEQYSVVNFVAGELLAATRNALQNPSGAQPAIAAANPNFRGPKRPTRMILTRWEFPQNQRTITLPTSFNMTTQYSESVFGQVLATPAPSRWTVLANEQGFLNVGIDEQLVLFLDGERKALQLAEAPQAAGIKGAWVYLDRGRAWGLHLNDRLVIEDASGKKIAGHIVGFYGQEMDLKSPRGYKIHEGAIMFVRKGQSETAIGQSYAFDPRRYP